MCCNENVLSSLHYKSFLHTALFGIYKDVSTKMVLWKILLYISSVILIERCTLELWDELDFG
jgi:hypothetical protein